MLHPAAHVLGSRVFRWIGQKELRHADRCSGIAHAGVVSGEYVAVKHNATSDAFGCDLATV